MYCEKNKTELPHYSLLQKSRKSSLLLRIIKCHSCKYISLNIMPILSYMRLSRLPTDPKTNLQNHSSTSTTLALCLFSLWTFSVFTIVEQVYELQQQPGLWLDMSLWWTWGYSCHTQTPGLTVGKYPVSVPWVSPTHSHSGRMPVKPKGGRGMEYVFPLRLLRPWNTRSLVLGIQFY